METPAPERQQDNDADNDDATGGDDDGDDDGDASSRPRVAWLDSRHKAIEAQLYTSHVLSTANSRLFEFGAVLFLAALFPHSLLPMSVYALARSAAAILLAHPVGAAIDRAGRLAVVRASIVAQRAAVAASCAVLWVMVMHAAPLRHDDDDGGEDDGEMRLRATTGGVRRLVSGRSVDGLFALLCVLACVEKLAAMANLVAVERDWAVVMTEGDDEWRRGELLGPASGTTKLASLLMCFTVVNARMRRIDLFCKLLGPLFISLVAAASTLIAIWTVLGINVASVLVEYICIARVYKSVPALHRSPVDPISASSEPTTRSSMVTLTTTILPISSLPFYFRHPAFLPSFSLALLYLTVLSFSGQMVTFLLSIGYTPLHVGLARTGSTVVELSATWASPWLMRRIGPIRGGIWALSCQMMFLAAGLSWFLAEFEGSAASKLASATGLAVCVAFSRLGLWGYDLCAQTIVQDEVEADFRGTFSTVEAAFQNLFELLSFATTIVFSRPDQFRWPVIISTVAVYLAGGMYACFVRLRRGHLFHAPPCIRGKPERAADSYLPGHDGALSIKPIKQPEMSAVTGTVMTQPRYIHPTSLGFIHRQSPLARPTPTVAPVMHCVVDTGRLRRVAMRTVTALASSMQKPRLGDISVRRLPSVRMTW
ncbi:iron-regulated transporter [Purpureocillium lavendulum]|uniref:Solute carrier family 40 member n=1 Tax=Purpureocillium lavendulum TaxID=1247861 RepID=A0AB34FPT1_9HYPO|nr:iron-regulated transporter [Purpureocillium lavendulum]